MKIIKHIVYSNLWIAIGAASFTLNTYFLAQSKINFGIIGLIFFATLFTYNFQRLLKLKFKINLKGERVEWIKKNKLFIYILTCIAGIASTFLFMPFISKIWLLTIFSALITTFYVVKIPGLNGKNLRDIPGIKIYTIAIVWSISTVIIPELVDNLLSLTKMVLLAASNFLFIISITIPFDIRDINLDDPSKKTIPQLIGVKKANTISIILLILSQFVICFVNIGGLFYAILITLITLPLLWQSETKKPELFFSGLIDGILILTGVFGYFIFNANW